MYGPIGDSVDAKGKLVTGISGIAFANEIQYLQAISHRIKLRINSIGGSVLEGYSIISAILNSKVPIDIYIDGIAASIAGVIAMCGTTCTAKDYATWMGHEAAGGEDERVRNMVTDTLVTVLTNRTKKTPEEIKSMLVKETWISNSRHADYTLEQGVQMGMFDSIESSGKKVNINKTDSLVNMAMIYNKLITPTMEKIRTKFNFSASLSEEAVENAAIDKLDTLTKENDGLKAEINALKLADTNAKEAAKTVLTNKSTALVEGLIKDGKLKEEEKADTITALVNNFDFTAGLLGKLTNVKTAAKIFDFKNAGNEGGEDRSKWKFVDWSKNDEAGLLKMQNEHPEAFNKLVAELPKQLSNQYNGL